MGHAGEETTPILDDPLSTPKGRPCSTIDRKQRQLVPSEALAWVRERAILSSVPCSTGTHCRLSSALRSRRAFASSFPHRAILATVPSMRWIMHCRSRATHTSSKLGKAGQSRRPPPTGQRPDCVVQCKSSRVSAQRHCSTFCLGVGGRETMHLVPVPHLKLVEAGDVILQCVWLPCLLVGGTHGEQL